MANIQGIQDQISHKVKPLSIRPQVVKSKMHFKNIHFLSKS